MAMQRWLQVTIPLTIVTLFLAWSGWKYAEMSKKGQKQPWRFGKHLDSSGDIATVTHTGFTSTDSTALPRRSWWLSMQDTFSNLGHLRKIGIGEKSSALPLHHTP
jgi:hypothetical protein